MPVTIRECPHCYTRVAFNQDELCPACGKKLSDFGADPSKTLFSVSEASLLPPICIQCGRNTDRRFTISARSRSIVSGILKVIWAVFVYSLTVFSRSFLHLLGRDETEQKHPYQSIRVSIPLCQNCRRNHGLPKPQRVNFEERTISFLVSKAIAIELSTKAPTKFGIN